MLQAVKQDISRKTCLSSRSLRAAAAAFPSWPFPWPFLAAAVVELFGAIPMRPEPLASSELVSSSPLAFVALNILTTQRPRLRWREALLEKRERKH